MAGYKGHDSRSGRGWSTCGDNYVTYWDGSHYVTMWSCWDNSWFNVLICKDRLAACNNGVDDDGDGLVDYPADIGCASEWDDSEIPHDTDC